MKRYWKMLFISGVMLAFFNLIPTICSAQIGDPGEDPDAPIDGGVGLLLAAGVGYGVKKVRENRKKGKESITENHEADNTIAGI